MPRGVIWLTGILGLCLLLAVVWVITHTYAPASPITIFNQLSRCDEPLSTVSLDSLGIATLLDQPAIMPSRCWQPVALPENNPAQDIKVNLKHPQLRRIWYRLSYPIPEHFNFRTPLMVYVPRIIGHAWQIRVNGNLITDNRYDWRSTWNRPVSAEFFVHRVQAEQSIDIEIAAIASVAEGFSMSRIFISDLKTIRQFKAAREYWQITMPQAASAVMLLLGLFFLFFWLGRRPETEYFLLSLSCLAFSVHNLQYTLSRPDDPFMDGWYVALVYDCSLPWLVYLVHSFCERFDGYKLPKLNLLLWLHVVLISIVSLPIFDLPSKYNLLKTILYTIAGITVCAIVVWRGIKSNNGFRIIALSLVSAAYVGGHDLLMAANLLNPESLFLVPYGGVILFAACMYAIQHRYVAAINNQERLNTDLSQQLTERDRLTHQLREQQNRLLELERKQALTQERQRLMRDMHDGVGSGLISALAAVENTPALQNTIADTLRSCIDDLRLVIDSMEPSTNDLSILLASIRYRLGQRLTQAGLELVWDIQPLPTLAWLEPSTTLDVLRLLQEALANVLKHANARCVQVSACVVGDEVQLTIKDDGQGFDQNAVTLGRGLQNQTKRAGRLGGTLKIDSAVGQGTCLVLWLPVNKDTPLSHKNRSRFNQ